MLINDVGGNRFAGDWRANGGGKKPQSLFGGGEGVNLAGKKEFDLQKAAEKLFSGIAEEQAPYASMAKDGVINYQGVVFSCNNAERTLSLGDVSSESRARGEVISVALSGGGVFNFNRDCIGDLSKAIGMFSPEDQRRIMEAIALDAKARGAVNEVEDLVNRTCRNLGVEGES